MAEPPSKPVIRAPPGYRHPANPNHVVAMPQFFRLKSENHRGRGWLFHCCCIFWILVLVLVFAFAVAAALIFFIYKPKPPVFRLQSFEISNLNITEAGSGTYQLNADTEFRAEVGNPNSKMRFNFGETTVEISVEEGEVGLGLATVQEFTVREKEAASLNGETSVKGEGVDERVKGRFENKEVVPRIEIRTRIGVNLQGWKMGNMEVSVRCGGVSWKNMDLGIMPRCTFTLLVW